ncbi:MAG: GAF domain-containing protein [Anaerolineae bacterium]|nr:GAF domain-containing protein [Anaerolineae bacterium]
MTDINQPEILLEPLKRQNATSAALASARTLDDAAASLLQYFPRSSGLSLSVIRSEVDEEAQILRLTPLVQSGASTAQPNPLQLGLSETGYPLDGVGLDSPPLLIESLEQDRRLNSAYRAWLQQQGIAACLNIPLRAQGDLIGWVSLNSLTPSLTLDPLEVHVLQVLVNQLGGLFRVQLLQKQADDRQQLLVRQSRAFAELDAGMDFETMAGIVARHMIVTPGRFLGISQYTTADDGEVSTWQIRATANRERTFKWENSGVMDWRKVGEALRQSVYETRPFMVSSVKDNPDLFGPDLDTVLQENGVEVFLNIPMHIEGKPIGAFFIMSRVPTAFTTDEMNAYSSLADQISTLIHSRSLLDASQSALDETRLLYEVNRAILASQDTLDILRVIRKYLAADAAFISHLNVAYNKRKEIADLVVTTIIMPDDEQSVHMSLVELIGSDTLAQLDTYWNTDQSPVLVVEDIETTDSDYPLASYLKTVGTRSFINIPIRERGRVLEMVSISYIQPHRIDDTKRRLYSALSDQIAIVLENHRLLHEAQVNASSLSTQVGQMQAANQLATLILTAKNEDVILEESSRSLVKLLGIDHCGITIIDPNNPDFLIVRAEYPIAGARGARIPLKGNPLWMELQKRNFQPLYVPSREDPLIEPVTRETLAGLGIHSLALIPIVASDAIVGGVGLDVYAPDKVISNEMLELAQILTFQLNISLQNLRLVEEAQHRVEQLQRIAAFSQSTQASLDTSAILKAMLEESSRMLPQNQVTISLYDPATQRLRVVAQSNYDEVRYSPTDGDEVPIIGPLAAVWESGQVQYIPDLRKVATGIDPNITLRSWLLTPVVVRGRVTGIVTIGSDKPNAYSETDLALFSQMVNQFATTLENTEIYRLNQRVARNESLVNEISTQLQHQFDIQSMLNITANELGKAIGAKRARIRLTTSLPEDQTPSESE